MADDKQKDDEAKQTPEVHQLEVKLTDADLLFLGNEQKRYKTLVGMAMINRDQAFTDYVALVAVRKNISYNSELVQGVQVDPKKKKAYLLLRKK